MSNLTPTSPPLFRPNRSPCLSRWRCAIQSRSIEELRAFDGSNPKKPLFPGRGRDGIASCRMRIENSLYKSSIYCSILTRSRTACKRRSVVTFASMIGRKTKKQEVVIPEPDYRIPVALLGIAGGLAYQDNLLPAATVGLLGLLLLFQTTRVRFVFDEEALEVRVGDELQESGENVFVGGKNRWRYSSFVNWELWWPNFPILVYFKETQTKPEGQVHFFPVIFNGKQLYDVMVERAGPSKTSSPK